MATIKALRARWQKAPLNRLAERINDALNVRSVNDFVKELHETDGCIDLRGAPLTRSAVDQTWDHVDFSVGVTEIWRGTGEQFLDGPFGFAGMTLSACRFVKTGIDLGEDNRCVDCDFTGAKLAESRIQNCEFVRCDFRKANFRRAKFYGSKFIDCLFEGANLGSVTAEVVDFSGSDMRGIKRNGATFFGDVTISSKTCYDAALSDLFGISPI
jgi:uncharacterized protein YjbI with pentapeptide repeats